MLETVVHFTHEAGFKVGGIGAVLDGLLGAPAYVEAVPRTVRATSSPCCTVPSWA